MTRSVSTGRDDKSLVIKLFLSPSQKGIVCSSVFYAENSEKIATQATVPCGHKPPIFPRQRNDPKDKNLLFLKNEYAKTTPARQQLIEACPLAGCGESGKPYQFYRKQW